MSNRANNRFARVAAALAAGMLIAGAAAPASAASGNDNSSEKSAGESQAAKVANEKQRYCVVGPISGSRLDRKTCKTREDWIKSTGIDPVTIAR